MVIQKYVHNPLLLEGHKFDLRIYVLVTSFSPLEAFIYKRGYARLSSRPYNLIANELTDRFIHLTNAAVNRQNQNTSVLQCLRDASEDEAGGTKCSLEYLWRKLQDSGINTEAVWNSICEVVVKSLICADDVIPNQPNSFELFGYDIMIDETLKVWLIEVNSSPSMETDCSFDEQTKSELIYDTISLVNPMAFDAEALVSILRRRSDLSAVLSKRGPSSGITPAAAFGSGSRMSAQDRAQLNEDIDSILLGQRIRPLGEMPENCGNYQRICPGSDAFLKAMKLKLGAFKR
jgi:tubulin polyglutamylase TTLL5